MDALARARILLLGALTASVVTVGMTPSSNWVYAAPAPLDAHAAVPRPASEARPSADVDWAEYVRAENALPGTPGMLITPTRGKAPGLAAYADRVSVRPGETVGLYVSTSTTRRVRARALRVGYYHGVGVRQVWSGTFVAHRQAAAATLTRSLPDAGGARNTRATYAPWRATYVVATTGWPEGAYLIRIDAGAASRYVLLTVRSASAAGRMLVVSAPMTWQAYNTWGGRGLYGDDAKSFSRRSLAVSFDRPYADGYGSGRFLTYDRSAIITGERLGLPLAWATDYDLAVDRSLVRGATAVVVGGHAEYWTGAMHDDVVHAVALGTNLAVLGANTSYWRVRMAGRTIGLAAQPGRRDGRPRIVFGPKSAALDPLAKRDPSGATARFRDYPHPRREEALTGMRYDCFPASADWVVTDPSWWGYAGTGLHRGSRLVGLVGPESDRVYPVAGRPAPMEIVAYTRLSCRGHATAQTGVYWTNRAGAGVFDAGTMRWRSSSTSVGRTVAIITANVLREFARPHAGLAHPARDNVASFRLPRYTTSGAA